jgi:hypothetical protein
MFLDHTQRRTTVGRTPGRAISSSQRPLPDNTRHSQQTNIHAPGGSRTNDFSKWAACGRSLTDGSMTTSTDLSVCWQHIWICWFNVWTQSFFGAKIALSQSLMSSLIVVDVRERVCLQFVNWADNVSKAEWELAKPCVWVLRCLSITQYHELFGEYSSWCISSQVTPHVCCQCDFFHIFPKVGCFEACIELICGW